MEAGHEKRCHYSCSSPNKISTLKQDIKFIFCVQQFLFQTLFSNPIFILARTSKYSLWLSKHLFFDTVAIVPLAYFVLFICDRKFLMLL